MKFKTTQSWGWWNKNFKIRIEEDNMKWQKQWALEIADSKAGVGTDYQDALSDCIAEADSYITQLEATTADLLKALRTIGWTLHDVPLNIRSIARHAIDKAKP